MCVNNIMDTTLVLQENPSPTVSGFPIQPLVFDATLDTTNMHNVLLIDSTVSDFQQYTNANTFPIIYNRTCSKEQMLEILHSKFQSISRIAFVSHFSKEPYFLNNELLFSDANTQFIVDVIKQFNVLHMDYLACNTLQNQLWTLYYTKLHNETGVKVGASNDNTGNLKYGGDWIMESTQEDVQTIYFNDQIQHYSSLLVILTINGINYTTVGSTATVSTHTNAEIQALNGIINILDTITDNGIPYTVVGIASSAFQYCTNLTSVTIPNSVTTIDPSAFHSCSGLTSISIRVQSQLSASVRSSIVQV